jgi:hypothetical protein
MAEQDFTFPLPPLTFLHGLRYSHDPRLVGFHARQMRKAERLSARLTGTPKDEVRRVHREIWRDTEFLREFLWRQKTFAGREPHGYDFMYLSHRAGSPYFHQLVQYTLVRLLRPSIVVETGGTPGNSSAFILRAMDRNGRGELHTVDLPPAGELISGKEHGGWIHEGVPAGQGSGWAAPEWLRERHRQHLGDAKALLPELLRTLGEIDVFIHDSDHSYEHMLFEFGAAWPALRPGGVLMSDDIDANAAWAEFTAERQLTTYRAGQLGAAAKPR